MTTPTPLATSAITSVLLADGWHPVAAGTLFMYYNPQFTNPLDGSVITVGGQWIQFTDTSSPAVTYGVPAEQVQAVQWTPQPGQ